LAVLKIGRVNQTQLWIYYR